MMVPCPLLVCVSWCTCAWISTNGCLGAEPWGPGPPYVQLQQILLNSFPKQLFPLTLLPATCEGCHRPLSSPAPGVTNLLILVTLVGHSGISVCISLTPSKALCEVLVQVSYPGFYEPLFLSHIYCNVFSCFVFAFPLS